MNKYLQLTILLLTSLLFTSPTQAAKINIWPIKVSLWPDHQTDMVNLTNEGDAPVNIQAYAKAWDMDETGQFIETDTGEFVFFPRLFTLQPKEVKVVRVGYQGQFPTSEKPYRLYFEELPPVLPPEEQAKQQNLGVTYKLRLSLPLFVMPAAAPPQPQVEIDGVEQTANGIKVGVKAPGTHHIQVSKVEVQLLDATNASLTSAENKTHLLRILPQRRVFVDLPLDHKVCAKADKMVLKVFVEKLKEPYEKQLALRGGSCAIK